MSGHDPAGNRSVIPGPTPLSGRPVGVGRAPAFKQEDCRFDACRVCFLENWQDWDGAAYELGIALGLFDPKEHSFQTDVKHVFWTANPIGNALHEILNKLVEVGYLERRDEPDIQFRLNKEFKGTWK